MVSERPAAGIEVTPRLVRGLLRSQHPDLAAQRLRRISSGWDNEVLRLGDQLAVRVPRRAAAVPLLEKELRWLPLLAADLPLSVPLPVRAGRPDETFPWPWAVLTWLPGRTAAEKPPRDVTHAARVLGEFVRVFSRPAPPHAPVNPLRGVPLRARDDGVRRHVSRLRDAGVVDPSTVLARWEDLVEVPDWNGVPVWLHGDLHPANVLSCRGRLSAVIDFGDLTAGDPATDLSVAWMMFGPADRRAFREAAAVEDEATWCRARGNALAHGLACCANSADQPLIETMGRRTIQSVLDDRD
jgi:aminoglycoside phosphotransferase (APT) family kinase protein